MSRRNILTAVELVMAASALAAATYALIRAVCNPHAAVQWAPVDAAGAGTALLLVGLAALLFAGRAGLLLAVDATDALRRNRAIKAVRRERERRAALAAHGQHRAPLPPTLRLPTEELAAAGQGRAGGGR